MSLRARWFLLGAAALLLIVFGPSLAGEFVWDDAILIAKNRDLTAPGGLVRLLSSDVFGGAGSARGQAYRPIPVLTFWLQANTTGASVVSMRLFNVVVHFACGALLFTWLRRRGIRPAIAAACALLFLVHPSVSEPVAWLVGRHDTLGALFILIAVLAWNETLIRALVTSLACAAAFLCKEPFVVAPLLVAISAQRARASLVLPFIAVGLVFPLRRALGIASGSDVLSASPLAWITHYTTIALHYFVQLATLRDGRTTEWYRPLSIAPTIIAVIALVVVSVAVVRARNVGVAWFLIAIAPLTLAIPVTGMWGNRYAYVPLIGLIVAAAHALDHLLEDPRRHRIALFCGGGAIAVCALVTAVHARRFRTELSLFGADVAEAPDDPRALYHYGTAVYARAGCNEALPLYQRAVEHDPRYTRALRNVAGCALNLARHDVAETAARAAIALEPDNAVHAFHLGAALAGRGQTSEARVALLRSIALDPNYSPPRRLLVSLP